MAIRYREFNVPLHPDWENANSPLHRKKPMKIRVFYDDTWASNNNRKILMFFSGGSGINLQTETSTRVVHAVTAGYLYIDTISVDENFYGSRNVNFPNINFVGTAFDVPAYLNFVYTTLLQDATINKYYGVNTPIVMLGHSRGAGALIQWANMVSNGSTQMDTPYRTRVKGIVVNSPSGSGEGGHPATDRAIRNLVADVENNKFPNFLYTVGAGDTTHTTKAFMMYVQALGFPRRKETMEFRVVGDNNHGHGYPTDTAYGGYQMFLNLGIELMNR